jgi:DNA primase large subunit
MDPFHANYPFLDASRDAVRETDVGLAEIITAGGAGDAVGGADDARHPAVERGVQRVERALLDGTIDLPEGERHPGVQAELLSYPVSRVLVSLLDAPGAIDKYADAEAATAAERFTEDFETLPADRRTPENGKVPLRYFLHEFDLAGRVERDGSDAFIDVAAYLRLTSGLDGREWRLVQRPLDDGRVKITASELHELLRVAVRQRVASGLPTTVPEEIRAGLTSEVAELEDAFSEIDFARDIDVLDPECFPPCASSLVERAQAGESLSDPAEFALVSFLTSANADPDELLELTGADSDTAAKAVRYRADRVGDESGSQYAPPSCETMAAYGECPVVDEESGVEDSRCETISHPLSYYEEALSEAD